MARGVVGVIGHGGGSPTKKKYIILRETSRNFCYRMCVYGEGGGGGN